LLVQEKVEGISLDETVVDSNNAIKGAEIASNEMEEIE
jgi:hypothetical protein